MKMNDCDRPDCPRHLVDEINDLENRIGSLEATILELSTRFDTVTKMTQFVLIAIAASFGIDVSGGM